MSYFDTHAHYDWKEFDKDREELFNKFKETLCGLVNIGINIESANKVIEYANKYSYMYYSLGIHPMEVEKEISINLIEQIVKNELKNKESKLVAIGETGLDYHFNYPIESQEDVEKILKEYRVKKTGIMHCYSGTPSTIAKLIPNANVIKNGFSISRSSMNNAISAVENWLKEIYN